MEAEIGIPRSIRLHFLNNTFVIYKPQFTNAILEENTVLILAYMPGTDTYFNQQSSRMRSTHRHNVVWNKIYVSALCSNIGQETSNAVSNALCGSTFISVKRR